MCLMVKLLPWLMGRSRRTTTWTFKKPLYGNKDQDKRD
jgi:hypothetical protein